MASSFDIKCWLEPLLQEAASKGVRHDDGNRRAVEQMTFRQGELRFGKGNEIAIFIFNRTSNGSLIGLADGQKVEMIPIHFEDGRDFAEAREVWMLRVGLAFERKVFIEIDWPDWRKLEVLRQIQRRVGMERFGTAFTERRVDPYEQQAVRLEG